MNDRYTWEKNDLVIIDQNALDCKDCKFKTKMVGVCPAFQNGKPKDVIGGGKCLKKQVKEGGILK